MKRFILFLIILTITLPVNAKDNRLYFSEENKRLYFESSLLDKNIFINHLDMTPGTEYNDKLIIENSSNKDYTLYFKVEVKEQNENALELLDNILMKIYINDDLIYDGKSTGIDYNVNGINLQDAIKIGVIPKNSKVNLVATTKLDEEYSNVDYNDYSYVDWNFYAEYDDSIDVIVPRTDLNQSNTYKIAAFILLVFSFIVFFTLNKNNILKKQEVKNSK